MLSTNINNNLQFQSLFPFFVNSNDGKIVVPDLLQAQLLTALLTDTFMKVKFPQHTICKPHPNVKNFDESLIFLSYNSDPVCQLMAWPAGKENHSFYLDQMLYTSSIKTNDGVYFLGVINNKINSQIQEKIASRILTKSIHYLATMVNDKLV